MPAVLAGKTEREPVHRVDPVGPFSFASGAICVLALDHRESMREAYARAGRERVTQAAMLAAKTRILEALSASASAVMLDQLATGAPRAAAAGLIMPLEAQGYDRLEGGRTNRLMADFGAATAAARGAHGCKLLVYVRPDHPASYERQLALVESAAGDCRRSGLALIVEPTVYRLDDESDAHYGRRFGDLVASAVADVARAGADLLKLQYPGGQDRCQLITDVAGPVPWTLLGGSVDGGTFAAQLSRACAAGASGFIAGRAIWGRALALAPSAQSEWLRQAALPLLEHLREITERQAIRSVVP